MLTLCVLGVVLLCCFNVFLGYSADQWTAFAAGNITGAAALAWVVGISFMVRQMFVRCIVVISALFIYCLFFVFMKSHI